MSTKAFRISAAPPLVWFLLGLVPALTLGAIIGPALTAVVNAETARHGELIALAACAGIGVIGAIGGWLAAAALHHRLLERDLETARSWIELLGQNAFERVGAPRAASPALTALQPTLERAAASLRRRFAEDTARLRESDGRAAALVRAQSELEQVNYIVSHHLQEPLIRITTYLDMFGRQMRGKLDPPAARFLSSVHAGVKRIETLIDDLTLYSRSIYGPPDLYETDTAALVGSVLDELDIEIIESAAEITTSGLPVIWANPDELAKVFRHLIANAIRFRRSDAPRIGVSAERSERRTIFRVRDNGIGIDPHYQRDLFTVFERVHTDAAYVGSGIGLAVCKKVVEHHGGEIWVDSTPGEGSTFSFSIHDRAAATTPPRAPEKRVH